MLCAMLPSHCIAIMKRSFGVINISKSTHMGQGIIVCITC